MNLSKPFHLSILSALVVFALGGCSMFHTHIDYSKAAEARSLEIPPDLDSPVTAGELVIPSSGRDSPKSDSVGAQPPSLGAVDAPSAAVSSIGGDGLHIADSVASTWRRVGVALERAQIGKLAARDESASSYTIEISEQATSPKPRHWFKRWFSHDQPTTVVRQILVKVTTDKDGALITVLGDAKDSAVAQRIITALRERLL